MVNKEHSDFPKYKEEADALLKQFEEELEKVEAEFKYLRGKDGPSSRVCNKFVLEIKALQKKYHYLFEK